MTLSVQRTFAGGEIAPALYGRVDTVKYATGLRTCKNWVIMRHGGATTRAGMKFVCEVKDSADVGRLVPFVFNADQTYVLELGDLYMRVIKNGAQLRATAQNITGVTAADPAVVTIAGHGYSNGDEVYITGVSGMTELNNRNFKIANVAANTFELQLMDGSTDLDATGYTAYTSGGTAAKVYEVVTPWAKADLADLHFVQSADVITVAHPSYAPYNIERTGDTSWTVTATSFEPTQDHPQNLTATKGGVGTNTYKYKVTAVSDDGEESFPALEATTAITAATQADPVVITAASHGISNGETVHIDSVAGMIELNDRTYVAANVAANTLELEGLDGTAYTAYTSGGTVGKTFSEITSASAPSVANPHQIDWDAITGAVEYNIYREEGGIFGFLATTDTDSFDDTGAVDPDISDTPPAPRKPFIGTDNYPSTVGYHQQRRLFANTNNDPEKVWASQVGNFTNFSRRSPVADDDEVEFTLAGRQVNSVQHLLGLKQLVALTAGGEWAIQGDSAGILKPTAINAQQYSYNGSATIQPLFINENALYIQGRGGQVRDLGFDFEVDGYKGNDLTIFSAHLFEGKTLSDWAYQQIPQSVVWAVRDDGDLLGLTYVRNQELLAWHHHDTDGTFENVAVVPEGDEDFLYVLVNRTINSNTVRYIERVDTRTIGDIEDYIGMDSAASLDGTHTGATTMTLTGSGWTFTDPLTLTASVASTFVAGDVGNQIHLTGADGTVIRFTIDAFTSGTVVTGRPHKDVPAGMQAVAISTWGKAVDEISGLWHLEGEDVSVFADGFVVANPNNSSYTTVTVSDGSVTLDRPYVVIHIGLPIIADIQTLDLDTVQSESMVDKQKLTTELHIYLQESRGIWAGSEPPSDDDTDPLEGLEELKIREDEDYDDPVALFTGVADMRIEARWNANGRVFVRQVEPVPASVLAIAPSGWIPYKQR